ncbi:MAG: DUF488 domain-containing protein [Lachnospiraceae bacterium]|nr:DUF488 domain-containing protein [Lachnospiraceae bacterium]
MSSIFVKRIYEQPEEADGYRVLVDRLWPRGISKEKACLDSWCKEIAPSGELRKWFHHEPDRYEEFRMRYLLELQENPTASSFKEMIEEKAADGPVTLLYSAKDRSRNNAIVLREWLDGRI